MHLGDAYIKHDRLLIHPYKVTEEHRPYFRSNKLYLGFDEKIGDVDQSLLNVPLVGSIITYFWMHNKDVEINTLDEQYVKNLLKLQKFFMDTYELDFSSELIVKKTVNNQPSGDESLLFFSGGLDSTYSLYDNLDKKLRMLMICGYDMYMNHGVELELRNKWHRIYSKFARDIGIKMNFAYTNARWILNEDRVQNHSDKRGSIKTTTYWGYLRHGVCLTGLASPLSNHFKEMISSANGRVEWDTTTKENAFATGTNIDPMLGYGGRPNHYHGTIDRHIKARQMRGFLNSGVATLRVCYKPTMKLNCMICEKCLRTLSQLVVAEVDSSKCGMPADERHWQRFIDLFEKYKVKTRRVGIHFIPMQKYITENNPELPEKSRIFFDYLMEKNLEKYLEEYAKRHPTAPTKTTVGD